MAGNFNRQVTGPASSEGVQRSKTRETEIVAGKITEAFNQVFSTSSGPLSIGIAVRPGG